MNYIMYLVFTAAAAAVKTPERIAPRIVYGGEPTTVELYTDKILNPPSTIVGSPSGYCGNPNLSMLRRTHQRIISQPPHEHGQPLLQIPRQLRRPLLPPLLPSQPPKAPSRLFMAMAHLLVHGA